MFFASGVSIINLMIKFHDLITLNVLNSVICKKKLNFCQTYEKAHSKLR